MKSDIICILLCNTTIYSKNLMVPFSTKTPHIGRSYCNVKNKSHWSRYGICPLGPYGKVIQKEDRGWMKKNDIKSLNICLSYCTMKLTILLTQMITFLIDYPHVLLLVLNLTKLKALLVSWTCLHRSIVLKQLMPQDFSKHFFIGWVTRWVSYGQD